VLGRISIDAGLSEFNLLGGKEIDDDIDCTCVTGPPMATCHIGEGVPIGTQTKFYAKLIASSAVSDVGAVEGLSLGAY
jgi:hypothetical protein